MMSHQVEKINKEIESIKRSQIEIMELKSIITEMRDSLEELNNRFEQVKERIRKHEDRAIDIIQYKKQEKMKKNKQSLRDLWDTIKCTNIRIMGQKGRGKG